MSTGTPEAIDPLLSLEQRVVALRDTVLFLAAQAEVLDRRDLHRQLDAVKAELTLMRADVHVAQVERARLRHKVQELSTRGRRW